MWEWLGQLAAQLGSTIVIVGAVAWVARAGIEHWLGQRLEAHKADLAHASSVALEQAKSDFRVREFRASRVVEKQALIIAGVFSRLEALHQAVDSLAAPVLHKGGKAPALRDEAIKQFNEFTEYYYPRAIWLERDTCGQLNDLVSVLRKLLRDLSWNLTEEGEVAHRQKWVETYNVLKAEIPRARGELDKEFRAVLGVSTGQAHVERP